MVVTMASGPLVASAQTPSRRFGAARQMVPQRLGRGEQGAPKAATHRHVVVALAARWRGGLVAGLVGREAR